MPDKCQLYWESCNFPGKVAIALNFWTVVHGCSYNPNPKKMISVCYQLINNNKDLLLIWECELNGKRWLR